MLRQISVLFALLAFLLLPAIAAARPITGPDGVLRYPLRSCFEGFTPALLCGRKSRVLLHANYLARVFDRQAAPRSLIGGPKRCCRTAPLPPVQRLRVNAERSEPKGSVYAEWRRW